ncbi:PML-RARA-regulated adapter molecule 1 [Sigmodon hispidus]
MEEPSKPSPDVLATAEFSSSEPDKEVASPDLAATTTLSSVEEPGPNPTAIPSVWDCGGPPQQLASTAPDSCQPGSNSTGVGINDDLRLPRRRLPPGKQIPCSSPGCCLSFPSIRDLAQHLRTHCPPTQSLEGKLFRCSALSCTESFPSMQELVAHGKLHYKPNRYFKCENCLLRFRTHRSLFKHLHVCAEHAQSPAAPPPPALDKEPPVSERPPESDPSSTLSLPFPLLEPFTSAPTGPFLPYLNPAPFGLSPPRLRPFLAAAPGPLASSTAIWKKSQGAAGSPRRPQGGSDAPSGYSAPSRIVWEHTRGRYSCMQCDFSTASRPAMTLHLQDHRPGAPTALAPGSLRADTRGSNQDFRNLQAKFQASQQEPGEPSRKNPNPEFNKLLKKFPKTELSEQPKKASQSELSTVSLKPLQLQFADLPKKTSQSEVLRKSPKPELTDLKKPLQSELKDLPRKPLYPEFIGLKKPPQPESTNLPKKLPKPEFGELTKKCSQLEASQEPNVPAQKPLKPELSNSARPPVELKPITSPKKFRQSESSEDPLNPLPPESSTFPKKPPKPQAAGFPRKSLTQSNEVSQTSKSGSTEFNPHSTQPDISTFPKNSLQSEFNEKLPYPQAISCPKSPQQLMSCEVPQTTPWKPESCNLPSHSPQPDFHAFPKKHPQLQLSDLIRTSSEPEVRKVPKKPQEPDLQVLPKKPSKPELGNLPRTSSEPEFSSLPKKFLQPQHGKFFQPDFPRGLPRKPKLPGSVSECSLPSVFASCSPHFPLSPGYGVPGIPRWRSEHFQVQHLPRRRPLPSASSLGSPPVKPPLPPVPINIQSFWRASATTTAVPKMSSSGTHFPAQQPQYSSKNQDEIYELYDAVETTDEVLSTQQATKCPQQDTELRKNATQPQQLPPTDLKLLKQIKKAEKAEREFRKKFKFEGEIVIHTKMMIDPNAKTRRGGGKHLGIRRGEIMEVIEFTNKDEMLCRDPKGKYGYVPRTALLPLETEVYDDVSFWEPLDTQPFPQRQ